MSLVQLLLLGSEAVPEFLEKVSHFLLYLGPLHDEGQFSGKLARSRRSTAKAHARNSSGLAGAYSFLKRGRNVPNSRRSLAHVRFDGVRLDNITHLMRPQFVAAKLPSV